MKRKLLKIKDNLISLKILILIVIISIIYISIYGQWASVILMVGLYVYYRALVNKFKQQIHEIRNDGKK